MSGKYLTNLHAHVGDPTGKQVFYISSVGGPAMHTEAISEPWTEPGIGLVVRLRNKAGYVLASHCWVVDDTPPQ